MTSSWTAFLPHNCKLQAEVLTQDIHYNIPSIFVSQQMCIINHSLEDLTQASKILSKGIILGKTGSVTFLFARLLLHAKDLCSFYIF